MLCIQDVHCQQDVSMDQIDRQCRHMSVDQIEEQCQHMSVDQIDRQSRHMTWIRQTGSASTWMCIRYRGNPSKVIVMSGYSPGVSRLACD